MDMRKLSPALYVAGQVAPEDMSGLAARGIRSIICNRPDGEEAGQPAWADVASAAAAAGIETRFIPVTADTIGPRAGAQFAAALAELPQPILAFCRTGKRCTILAQMASQQAPVVEGGTTPRFTVLIVGGGAGGIATAASLLKRRPHLQIAIVEPRDEHYYQPGWTLVGGGVFKVADTRRPMASLIPRGVTWLKAEAAEFDPGNNEVVLKDGRRIGYGMLVVATGNRLAWEEVEGLEATLGRNGVTSNYRYDLAPYTWQLVQELGEGRALFTQPPMPIKCAGAPQKAMYLACNAWERRNRLSDMDVQFHNAGAVLFGVPDYVPALQETVDRYGIGLHFNSNLIAVDGPAKQATFATPQGEVTLPFDMLHVVPPQKGNAVVAASELADAAGYAEVNEQTMQHLRYPNVFALGDGCSTSNAKTAAAVRKQAPVVAINVIAALDGVPLTAAYDGYGSCPLTVERGKIVLAEFTYGGKLAPTFPTWLVDGTRPSRLSWFLKEKLLPPIYWHAMLKGREWLAGPKPYVQPSAPVDAA